MRVTTSFILTVFVLALLHINSGLTHQDSFHSLSGDRPLIFNVLGQCTRRLHWPFTHGNTRLSSKSTRDLCDWRDNYSPRWFPYLYLRRVRGCPVPCYACHPISFCSVDKLLPRKSWRMLISWWGFVSTPWHPSDSNQSLGNFAKRQVRAVMVVLFPNGGNTSITDCEEVICESPCVPPNGACLEPTAWLKYRGSHHGQTTTSLCATISAREAANHKKKHGNTTQRNDRETCEVVLVVAVFIRLIGESINVMLRRLFRHGCRDTHHRPAQTREFLARAVTSLLGRSRVAAGCLWFCHIHDWIWHGTEIFEGSKETSCRCFDLDFFEISLLTIILMSSLQLTHKKYCWSSWPWLQLPACFPEQ